MLEFSSKNNLKKWSLQNPAGIVFEFLENGSIFSIMQGDILINQILNNPAEGSMNNLYLRVFQDGKLSYFPLLGPSADSEFFPGPGAMTWRGSYRALEYECRLQLAADAPAWFWTVQVKNLSKRPQSLDVIFAQDLALAELPGVRLNEAYTCQYLDHKVLKDEKFGYLICSRQNQVQGKAFPWIMHGCLNRAQGFLTDGFQFYGLSYKSTNRPEALQHRALPNKNYQYEFALPTLQSRPLKLSGGKSAQTVFFAWYEANHPQVTSPQDAGKLKSVVAAFKKLSAAPSQPAAKPVPKLATWFDRAPLFASRDLKAAELNAFFGKERRHVEKKGFSFFYGSHNYVALKAKEFEIERPHGQVLRSGREILPSDETLSSTAWMYGIFNSQVTVGNTSFNKLLSVSRNPLNVLKSSGQRIFVKTRTGYELLAMPSAFEIGLNHCRWIYRGKEDTIVVKVWTSMGAPACFLEIESFGPGPKEFLISHYLVLGNHELDSRGEVNIDRERGRVEFIPAAAEPLAQRYPETRFFLVSPDSRDISAIAGDGLLFADGQERGNPFLTVKTKPVKKFTLALTGHIGSTARAGALADKYSQEIETWEQAQSAAEAFWGGLGKNFNLEFKSRNDGVSKLNDIFSWYLHNAMVHFTIPHGLEQYSGAAWGLRDVCQGPVEFFYSTRHPGIIRQILRTVFSHQFQETGDWPQWFMFDRYREIQSHDSHADIIIWPLKAVCDYLELTDDFSILEDRVPYTDDGTLEFTAQQETIGAHLEKEIAKIEKDCIAGTRLPCYGHGDWEDTLQPADSSQRSRLVSAWTVELAYQTLKRYQRVCARAGRPKDAARWEAFAANMQADFNRHLVKNGVVAGLGLFTRQRAEVLLHPTDRKTGVHYRLLPMTRGMISEIFTPAQMRAHLRIIQKHLLFPDGVRLMNRPIPYRGGVEKYFKRAETAANFGREIGLQYVHAHIRYLEALAKIGQADELYTGLLAINPITIGREVTTARTRQSNAYFSSSDAEFSDRYEAQKHFAKIKKGQVALRGGWRIYSSGPGIYIHQLIGGFLGLRELFGDIVLDPVMPKKLNGLKFDFEFEGKKITYRYIVKKNVCSPERVVVNGQTVAGLRYEPNPYRRGGALIAKAEFRAWLQPEHNEVEIYL